MSNHVIKPFDVKNASAEEYRVANIFFNQMRAEQLPNDPPMPLEEQTQSFRNIPDFVEVHAWGVWNAGESGLIAAGTLALLRMEENKHVGEMSIEVLPPYRRQGIAHRLLALIAETARRENRRLLIGDTSERIPAGEVFMQRLGAQRGLENHTNQLDLAELNCALVNDWLARAQERGADFELGFWDGVYPEEDIYAIAELYRVMNSAPRGTLDVADFQIHTRILAARGKGNVGARHRTLDAVRARKIDRQICRLYRSVCGTPIARRF